MQHVMAAHGCCIDIDCDEDMDGPRSLYSPDAVDSSPQIAMKHEVKFWDQS